MADHLNDVIRRIDRRGIVTTIAGVGPLYEGYDAGWTDGVGPAAGDGGPALKAGFDAPWGIELDLAGNLYIADRDHDAIRKVDTHGIITTVAGTGVRGYSGDGGRATNAMLNRPLDVAPAWGGVRYIADENNARIRRVDAFGRITTIGGTGELGCTGEGGPATAAPIQNPNSLDLGWDGTLYFAEAECNMVRAIRPDGTLVRIAGTGEDACVPVDGMRAIDTPLSGPSAIAIDADGGLLVNTGCNTIAKIDRRGIFHVVADASSLGG